MHYGRLECPAMYHYRLHCRFSLAALGVFMTIASVAMVWYLYWAQRGARQMSASIAESKTLSQIDKNLLRKLVYQKAVMSGDLAFKLGLYWTDTWYYPDGPTVRHVAATCSVLWTGAGEDNRGDYCDVFVVGTHMYELDQRSEHVIIVLDRRGRMRGWICVPGYDHGFVSANMALRRRKLTLVIHEQDAIQKAKLTYSISSNGPRLVAIETARDTSRIRKLMPFLGIDGNDNAMDTTGKTLGNRSSPICGAKPKP